MASPMYVYILTNDINHLLYVGVTNDIERRMLDHRTGNVPDDSRTFDLTKLVFLDSLPRASEAFSYQRLIQGWSQVRQRALIASTNPEWDDLADELDLVLDQVAPWHPHETADMVGPAETMALASLYDDEDDWLDQDQAWI